MTPKIQEAVDKLTGVLEGWNEVVAVAVNSFGDDRFDPYFTLSFDVYTSAEIRDLPSRETAFGDVGAFESALLTHKDRFLMDDLPVRVEYKRTNRFDELVSAAMAGECRLRDTGTYPFRRVVDAKPVFARSSWLETLRANLSELPDGFWEQLRTAQQASAEHLYADLRAAAMREDSFYFQVTSGTFLVKLCALLFAVNRGFEPSPRALQSEVLELRLIPDSLPANMENFVAVPSSYALAQRAELAELMITAVLSL